jgi:hypothetical protein
MQGRIHTLQHIYGFILWETEWRATHGAIWSNRVTVEECNALLRGTLHRKNKIKSNDLNKARYHTDVNPNGHK